MSDTDTRVEVRIYATTVFAGEESTPRLIATLPGCPVAGPKRDMVTVPPVLSWGEAYQPAEGKS